MNKFFKVVIFFCFILFFLINFNVIAYSAFFKFNNLEEARKIYPKNQKKAKELIIEVINFYKNKKTKFPWVAYAYGELSIFSQKEKNNIESLNYRKKSCEEFEIFYQKKNDKKKLIERDENISTCYYLLASSFTRNEMFDEALEINKKNQTIFKKYNNFTISKEKGIENYIALIFQLASIYNDQQNYNKTIETYLNYLSLLKNNNQENNIKYLRAIFYLKNAYQQTGDFNSSKKLTALAIKNLNKYHHNNFMQKAKVYSSLAVEEDDRKKSYNFYLKAKNELEKINFQNLKSGTDQYSDYIQYYFIISSGVTFSNYQLNRNLSVLEKNIIEIEKFNKKLNILDQSIDGYERLETMYSDIGQYEKAKEINAKALSFTNKRIEQVKQIDFSFKEYTLSRFFSEKRSLLFNRAYIFLNLENTNEAQKILAELKPLEKNSNDRFEKLKKSNWYVLSGRIAYAKKDYSEAIKQYLLALKVLKTISNFDISYEETILNNLALTYSALGNYNLAENTFKKFITISNKKYGLSDINTLNNFAYLTNDLNTLCSISEKINKIYDSIDLKFRLTQTYINFVSNFGRCYLLKKDFNKAENIYLSSINFVKSNIENKNFYFDDYIYEYSSLLNSLKKTDKAIANLTLFIDSVTNNHGPDNIRILRAYKNLSSYYLLNKSDKQHIEYGIKALDIILSEIDKRNTSLDFNLYKYLNQHRIFLTNFMFSIIRISNEDISILERYKNRDFIDVLFIIQQILKINKLNTSIQRAVAIDMTNDPIISDDLKKITDLNKFKQQILLTSPSDINFNNLNYEKLNNIEKQIKALGEKIKKNYPDFKKNYSAQFATTSLVGYNLKNDEAYIEFTHSSYISFVTVLTKKKRNIKFLKISNKELENLIQNIRNSTLIENNNIKPFDFKSAKILYEKIFLPIEKDLDGIKKIFIVPEKQTISLPFELLVYTEYLVNKFLIEKYTISVMPSAGSFIGINNSTKFNKNKNFAGFGNPKIKLASTKETDKQFIQDFSKFYTRGGKVKIEYLRFLPELPETETELNIISQKFKNQSKLFTGINFTEANVKKFNFSNYKIINFASHALVAGEIEGLAEPAILTSIPNKIIGNDDGLLTTSEIAKLKINSDLIILSACNTASSDGKPLSDGLSGLANAFFYSGSKSLLVTHWPVISESTVNFISNLFDFIETSDDDVAKALQKSKIQMINSKSYSHPIYWAPYILVGRSKI